MLFLKIQDRRILRSWYLNRFPSSRFSSTIRAFLTRTRVLLPRDIICVDIATCWPNQTRLDFSTMTVHATHVEAGLGSLAPARTSPDVGFNERSPLSLVIPTTLDLEGRLRGGLMSLSRHRHVRSLIPYRMPCSLCCWRPWMPCATSDVDRRKPPLPALAESTDTWAPGSSVHSMFCPGNTHGNLNYVEKTWRFPISSN